MVIGNLEEYLNANTGVTFLRNTHKIRLCGKKNKNSDCENKSDLGISDSIHDKILRKA